MEEPGLVRPHAVRPRVVRALETPVGLVHTVGAGAEGGEHVSVIALGGGRAIF